MFTGLISDLGRVREVRHPGRDGEGDTRIVIATGFDTATLETGASIACSGACLTVVATGADWFAADVSAETLACTTLGAWGPGTAVNLERSLRLGDELGGHLVFGHVDGVGEVVSRTAEGDSWRFVFEVPAALAGSIAPKGSVALDGVSLTANEVSGNEVSGNEVSGTRFGVNIIPHTYNATTLGACAPGARVNVEIDMLARYVARQLEAAWPTRTS